MHLAYVLLKLALYAFASYSSLVVVSTGVSNFFLRRLTSKVASLPLVELLWLRAELCIRNEGNLDTTAYRHYKNLSNERLAEKLHEEIARVTGLLEQLCQDLLGIYPPEWSLALRLSRVDVLYELKVLRPVSVPFQPGLSVADYVTQLARTREELPVAFRAARVVAVVERIVASAAQDAEVLGSRSN